MDTLRIPGDALVILIAPAGAGKTTFVRRHFLDTEIVSSDRCRALVSDDEGDQGATRAAFEVFDAILRARLELGRLSVADATNLEPIPRRRLRDLAREYGRPAIAILLDVPIEIARARNLARERSVPDRVIDLHYARLQETRDVLHTEGYDAIYELPLDIPVSIVRLETARDSPAPPNLGDTVENGERGSS